MTDRGQIATDPWEPTILALLGAVGYLAIDDVAERTTGSALSTVEMSITFGLILGYMLLGGVVARWYFDEAGRPDVGWLLCWPVLLPLVVVIDRLRDDGETHAG